jgi:hypothetical protein
VDNIEVKPDLAEALTYQSLVYPGAKWFLGVEIRTEDWSGSGVLKDFLAPVDH